MNLILRIIITGALLLLFACKSVYKADPFPDLFPNRKENRDKPMSLH